MSDIQENQHIGQSKTVPNHTQISILINGKPIILAADRLQKLSLIEQILFPKANRLKV